MEASIREILNQRYVIPLYQRYLAWGEEQVNQLIQDIYESYKRDVSSNYFVGNLILLQRFDGRFEVIDGQQRLTVLTILARLFDPSRTHANLEFDSRPEVTDYLAGFYKDPEAVKAVNVPGNYSGIARWAKTTVLTEGGLSLDEAFEDRNFISYFFDNVFLVRIEMPQDTDVARYFEIMNNRGQQLQKHEILKARLLEKLNENMRITFGRLWDTASQMDRYIQQLFNSDERKLLFGVLSTEVSKPASETVEDGEDRNQHAILDFPNFLMHVLRLCYGSFYQKTTGEELPLNEKYLLDVTDILKEQIDAEDFILNLFRFRVIFDRYVVQQKDRGEGEDAFEWILRKPQKSVNGKEDEKLYYVRTFGDDSEHIIKALSMLQVTFRTRIYKRWLQNILSWFSGTNGMNAEQYLNKLNKLILEEYDNLNLAIEQNSLYSEGTRTPHFLLNFIDYLYYCSALEKGGDQELTRFEFRYRNSVEHHQPVSQPGDASEVIDCLGNLCLVSKSVNSRMNDAHPCYKVNNNKSDDLPPKRRIMYRTTRQCQNWTKQQILDHYIDLVRLLNERHDLLAIR